MILFYLEQYIWWSYATWDNTPTKQLDCLTESKCWSWETSLWVLGQGIWRGFQNNIGYFLCPSLSPELDVRPYCCGNPTYWIEDRADLKPFIWGLELSVSEFSIQAAKGGKQQHSYSAMQS